MVREAYTAAGLTATFDMQWVGAETQNTQRIHTNGGRRPMCYINRVYVHM